MTIDVLDGAGFVRLDEHMASDLSVVNSARVSFGKRHEKMEEGDDKLINFLLKHRHGTPFEHNSLRFHIKLPIFVMREWIRHRISSVNEMSGRYTELPSDFYVPLPDKVRSQVGKPGHYKFEPVEKEIGQWFSATLCEFSKLAYTNYQEALNRGVAKELARLFLPVNIMTEFYWTINARSLMNFLSLRNADPAMYEIRQYALVVEKIFADLMPITHNSFVDNGRVAP